MLGELTSRLSPWRHARFQKWSVSAVVGDLSPGRLTKLEKHIRVCAKCRRFLEDTAQSSLEAMPAFWEKRKPMVSMMPPEGMRARFLQRLNRQRTGLEDTIPMVELDLPLHARSHGEKQERDPFSPQPGRFRTLFRPVSIAAFLTAASLFLGGYFTGSILKSKAATAVKMQAVTSPDNSTTPVSIENSLETKEKLLQFVLADLAKERALAAAQREAMQGKLAESDARLISLQHENTSALQQSQEAGREAKDALAASRKENEALRKKISDADAILMTQERRTQELQNELQITRGRLLVQEQDGQRIAEEQQLAKGQLSDLVTARNLHIVDVYDADGGGRRKTSFGRVFYVEGKSLLFYAYDLQDAKQAKANVVFHVWGGRAGTKEVTHSLGILRNEDAKQGLWTMTFDDSSVLAQINSVFVTAESASRRDVVPHGKRVLYAYLGNPPNHP